MTDPVTLLAIGFAFFVVAVAPGPANISNAAIAMSMGRKISLIYGAGLSTGLIFWGVIAASGLGAILQTSIYLLTLLKVLGGAYLMWLAYQSFKASFHIEKGGQPLEKATSSGRWFLRGVILNASNPKTVIAWMAALSVGMGSNDSIYSLILAVTVCMVVGFFTNAMYSIVFSLGGVMEIYQRMSKWINRAVSCLFAFAGLGLLRSAFYKSTST